MNNWSPPTAGTMCPIRLPRCFSSSDIESPDFDQTWIAPNETAMSYVLLMLTRYRRESGIPIRIVHDWEKRAVRAVRM